MRLEDGTILHNPGLEIAGNKSFRIVLSDVLLNKKAGFAKWLVKNIADRFFERDEYYEQLRDEHFQKNRDKHYKRVDSEYFFALKESQSSLLKIASSD